MACVLPSDESHSVFVTIEQRSGIVNRGSAMVLRARAWQPADDGSIRNLDGVVFTWHSSDPRIASVAPEPDGRATITGVRSGQTRITAIPVQLEDAARGFVEIRVANTVEIDRASPDTVRYGQQLTLQGVGLGRIDRVFLGDAPLIADSTSFTGDSAGVGSMRFWVAFPASSGQALAAIAEGFSAASPDTIVVVAEDTYETGDTFPASISLDGPAIRHPDVVFFNPALAIEADASSDDSVVAKDHFHFIRSDTSRPLTVILKTPSLPLGQLDADIYATAEPFWSIGLNNHARCGGPERITGTRTDSVIRVLEAGATRSFRIDVRGQQGGYSIELRDGEPDPHPQTPADRFEYNDHCQAAFDNQQDEARQINLSNGVFEEELSIHRPYDIDWYKFDTGTDEIGVVSVRLIPLPAGAADFSDLDLFTTGLVEDGISATPGSSVEELQFVTSFTTEYDIVVFDQIGVPTRYLLCISLGTACVSASNSRTRRAAPIAEPASR
jgi:hypothetical protein